MEVVRKSSVSETQKLNHRRTSTVYDASSDPQPLAAGSGSGPVSHATIRIWIHGRDLDKLEQMVLDGHGERLLNETAGSNRVNKFLSSVRPLMVGAGVVKETGEGREGEGEREKQRERERERERKREREGGGRQEYEGEWRNNRQRRIKALSSQTRKQTDTYLSRIGKIASFMFATTLDIEKTSFSLKHFRYVIYLLYLSLRGINKHHHEITTYISI